MTRLELLMEEVVENLMEKEAGIGIGAITRQGLRAMEETGLEPGVKASYLRRLERAIAARRNLTKFERDLLTRLHGAEGKAAKLGRYAKVGIPSAGVLAALTTYGATRHHKK